MDGLGVDNGYRHNLNTSGWVEGAKRTQETQETQGTSTDRDGDGLVTFTERADILRKAPPIPTLAPAANLTPEERNSYYLSIYEKFGLSGAETLSHGNSVMFDVYSMMALIQQIGQKMRNVMRMLRKIENQAVFLNIKEQAAIQRQAAMVSMIVGTTMAVAQFAMMGKGLRDQFKGFSQQTKGAVNSGAEMAREQVQMTRVGGDRNLAAVQRTSVCNRAPEGLVQETPMSRYNAALEEFGGDPKLQTLKDNVAAKTNAVTEAEGKIYNPADENSIKAHNAEVASAKAEQGQAVKALDNAKMKLHNAALEDVEAYGNKFEGARQKFTQLEKDPKASSAEVKQARQEFQKAGEQYRIARANQVDISAKLGLNDEAYGGVSARAEMNLQRIGGNEAGSAEIMSSQRLAVKGQMIMMLSQSFGTMAQSFVQGIRDIISAKSTEMQAEQKVIEEQFEQIKDLFSLEQSVIQKAIDTLGSIFSREASINDQIWRA